MAAVAVTPDDVTRPDAGAALSALTVSAALAAADHWEVPNNGRVYLILSAGTGAVAFTITSTRTIDGLDVSDREYTVVANQQSELIGPFPPDIYGDSMRIDTDVAGATISALRL